METRTFDVIVVGAGPAGMSAACEARKWGLSVVLLDEQSTLGGQIYRSVDIASSRRRTVLGEDYVSGGEITRAFAASGAQHITEAAVWNVGRDMTVNYVSRGANKSVRGSFIVLASGAMERPFPIAGWTLPGVMGAGAAQILYKNSGALPSQPVVLAGCGPLLLLLANQYLTAGVKLKALVQTTALSDYVRASPRFGGAVKGWADIRKGLTMLRSLKQNKVPVFSGATRMAVEGKLKAEGLRFTHKGVEKVIESPLILLHQGVVPNTQITWSLRTKHAWNEAQLCWVPVADAYGEIEHSGIYIAGDSRGIVGAKAAALQGRLAAIAIANKVQSVGLVARSRDERTVRAELNARTSIRPLLDSLYRPTNENRIPRDDSVVICRCEEVTAGQIRKYVSDGCVGPNQTKAFGRCGMGPCQGRLCGLTVTELIADARNVPPCEVGYFRIRPPLKPITMGELAA
jgi:NADPH-dependent 2,4-dienoyl-CoA reductase/sulfur reductase-like enzyme